MANFIFLNSIGGGGTEIIVVDNYTALLALPPTADTFYWCENSQGTSWLPGSLGGTYYPKGMYYCANSVGPVLEYIEVPYQATQTEVDAGTVENKFVSPKTFNDSAQLAAKVSTSRSLTINGVTYDLTADRTWTVSTGVSSVSGTSPIASSGGTTPEISISQANISTDGYLSSIDWNTFNDKANKAAAITGVSVAFAIPQIYNSVASPATGNITDNLTGAIIGVVQKIYHNNSVAPTFPAGWVKLGSGTYTTSTLNIIYAEWVSGTRVEYLIVKGV